MRLLSILSIILLGCLFFFLGKEKINVKYYYEGPYQKEIQHGLEYWQTENFLFEKTNNQKEAYLNIFHVPLSQKTNSNWVAQYNHRSRAILIYDRPETFNPKNLIGIVSHEAGHFLGLDHNDEPDSVMNIKTPYHTIPSSLDKQEAMNLLPILFVKKIIDEKIFPKNI